MVSPLFNHFVSTYLVFTTSVVMCVGTSCVAQNNCCQRVYKWRVDSRPYHILYSLMVSLNYHDIPHCVGEYSYVLPRLDLGSDCSAAHHGTSALGTKSWSAVQLNDPGFMVASA